jgi:hypothetical protein
VQSTHSSRKAFGRSEKWARTSRTCSTYLYQAFRGHSGNIQGTFGVHQGTFREHSGHIQGTFRAHSGNIQGTFRAHSGNVWRPIGNNAAAMFGLLSWLGGSYFHCCRVWSVDQVYSSLPRESGAETRRI